MIAYLNGQFLPRAEAKISADDRGFLFADGVYEVVRVYGGRIFEGAGHWKRLARSLDELKIAAPAGLDYQALATELIGRNGLRGAEATVYLQITRGAAPRLHVFPDPATPPTVYAFAAPFTPHPEKMTGGVRVILTADQRWSRCDIKSVSLLPNILAAQMAREHGAEEAVLIRDGLITEGSKTNFAAVFDGQLVTHPRNNFILGGVTLDLVLRLCRELGIRVKESGIVAADLKTAQEAMLFGTTAEVMPVIRVDDWMVGSGTPGPMTRRLQEAFRAAVAAQSH
jgi:D-alanine transaminase